MCSARRCSDNPMLVIFKSDYSGSMSEIMPGSGMRKCDILASVVNKTLRELYVASGSEEVEHDDDELLLPYEDNVGGLPRSQVTKINFVFRVSIPIK